MGNAVITVAGKGGVGKTSISAAIVRQLVRDHPGARILAIDADPAVGLATALAVQVKETIDDIRKAITASGEEDKSKKTAIELLGESKFRIFDAMVEHDMFDLDTNPGKRLGGFCSSLHKYRLPFIFANFNGTSADVDVLTHEAGHAFECYLAFRSHPFVEQAFSTSEIAEIHSMTMEHFAYPWMPLFFGDQAEKYRVAHLTDALTTIPYLVSVDEYQHRVFEKPDMTPQERRTAWREIERIYMPWRDYDGNTFLEEGGFWMQKPHIFLDPFYYIEYALAQTCAFQFYDRMKRDRAKAWEDYCRLCRAGGTQGYFQLLKLADLRSPFEPGSVEQSVAGVLEELGV